MVSEYEDRVMKGRFLSPPACPLTVIPRATYRTEHVATHDGGADTNFPPREELVVESLTAAFLTDHLIAAAGGEGPFGELATPYPERILEILMGCGGITIE